MKKILIMLMSVGFNAWANFSGEWIGTGTVELKSNRLNASFKCDKFELVINQNQQKLDLNSCRFVCAGPNGPLEGDCVKAQFDINGQDLFLYNQKIGTITANEIKSKYSGNGYSNTFDAKIANEVLTLQSATMAPDSSQTIIRATMNR
jgi:hypothetical protein